MWLITWLLCVVSFVLPAMLLGMWQFVRQEKEMRDEQFE